MESRTHYSINSNLINCQSIIYFLLTTLKECLALLRNTHVPLPFQQKILPLTVFLKGRFFKTKNWFADDCESAI